MRTRHTEEHPRSIHRFGALRAMLVLLTVPALLHACGDDPVDALSPRSTAPSAEPEDLVVDPEAAPLESWASQGPHRVERVNTVIVDPVRTLPDRDGNDEPRSLDTAIWFPETSPGPRPLLVWNHGLGSTREDSQNIARIMASRGWVVAAPNFPRTSRSASERDLADVLNQPGDVSLVIDHMLARNADPGDPLHDTIDPSRIAAGGVSLGGLTSLVAAWTNDYREERLGAVIALGAPACYMPRPLFQAPPIPMLVIHGDADAVVEYETHGLNMFRDAPGPSIIVRLVDGSHIGMADSYGRILDGTPQPDVVACTSIGDSLSTEEIANLSEALGGPDRETIVNECRHPCSGDERDRTAMRSLRQNDLILQSCVSFLVGTFEDGPNIGTIAAQLDAEPDVDARAVSRHSSPPTP